MNKKHTHSTHHQASSGAHHHKSKKKVGLFYKITASVALIVFLLLSYFVILVSTEPKSIPYVTEKIEASLKERFGNDVTLGDSSVTFTRYGTLKVAVSNLQILYSSQKILEKQVFIIPKLESEFSLFNILLLRFHPTKIKIFNPEIALDDLQKLQQESDENVVEQKDHLALIMKLLSSIRKGKIPIKNFEIENAKLLIKDAEDPNKISKEIFIKKSQVRISVKGEVLNIASVNVVNFDQGKGDVALNSNCQLSKHGGLKCDLLLENFAANSISNFHPSLSQLAQIDAAFNATASFLLKDGELENLLFEANANRGSFEFLDFFGQKMDFNDLKVKGEYDNRLEILDLSEIKVDFATAVPIQQNSDPEAHMAMSLLISNFKNPVNKKLDFYIKLQNVRNDELEKFWPVSLHEHGIRNWVISNVKGGMIRNAYAKFSLLQDELGKHLNSMNSEIIFSDFNLEYSKNFPSITNVSGVASFTKDSMKISISNGNVLNSTISEGLIAIDDFHSPITTLKISGKSQGHAADSFKHIDHKSQFAADVEKYLNGNSQSDFDIRIPLDQEINLKDIYLAANSTISGLNTEYVNGGMIAHVKKDFGKNNFIANIDLTATELTAKAFDLEKKSNIESGLDFIISVKNPEKITLKNISLWKKEEEKIDETKIQKKKNLTAKPTEPKIITSKITGDAEFETAPFLLTKVNLKNSNFGKNNYEISYKADSKTSAQKLFVKGQQLNFASLIEQKFFQKQSGENNFKNSSIQIAVDNFALLRNKSLKNLYFSLDCVEDLCYRGVAKAGYSKKQFLNFKVTKKLKEKFATIDGRITDVGYLAEALGISNVISAGDARIKMREKIIDKKKILEGEIVIDNNITIYESPTVKRLSKNNLFSAIKDKIFSSEKTTFDSVKIEFESQDRILTIKSLIANNYKIGITAKGAINLKDDTYNLKGMIVPGFLINNLFGIGKIPLIGGVISGLLTGGEGGGLFGIHYTYIKNKTDKEAVFETNKVAAFVPATIQNLFE